MIDSTDKSYTCGQWQRVHRWVKEHRCLIQVHGVEFASSVACRSLMAFPKKLEDNYWSPLVGVSPSSDQITESMKVQGLLSNGKEKKRRRNSSRRGNGKTAG